MTIITQGYGGGNITLGGYEDIATPDNVACTTYPVISISGVDLGDISQVDQVQYEYVDMPDISGPVTVTILSPYVNTQIRYTLNGKIPNPSSHLYCEPLMFVQNFSSDSVAITARSYDLTNANLKTKTIRLQFHVV